MVKTKISYNSDVKLGKIKAMHAVGQPPFLGLDYSNFKYLKEANIPYSRLHDVGGYFGGNMYVDIPNIFRDFSADVNDPDSYDFTFTDILITELIKNNCEPYYRLGVTIENFHKIKAYRIFPPENFEKWAQICEHIIRHYNEGWADGFHYNIKYWEIWNEPEDSYDISENAMWQGTPEEFLELYRVASRHLKNCFGESIKIGAYGACENAAATSEKLCLALEKIEKGEDLSELNLIDWDIRLLNFVDFFYRFTKMVVEENLPFDFYSFHSYNTVEGTLKIQKFAEKHLHKLGLDNVEMHLNEWNTNTKNEERGSSVSAANIAALMCGMQKTKANIMCYYDARIGVSRYGGMFNPLTYEPFCAYYCFKAFGKLYEMGTQIECECDNGFVYTVAATNGNKNGILISNIGEDTEISLNCNADSKVYLIDEENMMTEIEANLQSFMLEKYKVLYIEENI